MIRVRRLFMLVFASVFAVAVLSTGCGEPTPKEEVNVVKDSTGPTPPPTTVPFVTGSQPGYITLRPGTSTSVKVSLDTFAVGGTVAQSSVSGGQIVANAPLTVQTITPLRPNIGVRNWGLPSAGITDQPVLLNDGDTVAIRR